MFERKNFCRNTEPRIGRPVTDGKIVFEGYQWRNGQIYCFWLRRMIKPVMTRKALCYMLTQDGKQYDRTKKQLYIHSFPEKFLPKNFDKWIDMFGYENLFCFNPQNPNQIWSKKFMKLIKLCKNNNSQSQHLLFNSSKDGKRKTLYVHKMVWQSYHKTKIQKGFVIHHLNHDCYDNRIQNMVLLPKSVHSQFEIFYNLYANKSEYYVKTLSKEEFIQKIQDFDIVDEIKQKLIDSL